MSGAKLWSRLAEAGLVEGDPPPPAVRTPWPIRVMLGIAGWLAAMFVLALTFMIDDDIYRRPAAAFAVGLLACGGAFALFRSQPQNVFAAQFGFAFSLAGQGLFVAGIGKVMKFDFDTASFLLLALIEAAAAAIMPNAIHRTLTTFASGVCLFLATASMGLPAVTTAFAALGAAAVWLVVNAPHLRREVLDPLGYGFALILLCADGTLLFGPEVWRMITPRGTAAPPYFAWSAAIATGAILLFAAWRLAPRAGAGLLLVALPVAIGGLFAPGIGAAMLLVVIGFAQSSRPLIGLGLLAFAGCLGTFYYQLTQTLLVKSAILAGTGLALLALRRLLPESEAPRA
jgi:Domain of unknown function (DUF4401)